MGRRTDKGASGGVRTKFYDRLTRQLRSLFPNDGGDEQELKSDILRRIKNYRDKLGSGNDLKIHERINAEIDKLWQLSELTDEKGNTIYNFSGKVRKMWLDYEDMVFWLSINSNESVETIKRFSHQDRIGFQQRLTKWLMDKQKRGNRGGEEEDG